MPPLSTSYTAMPVAESLAFLPAVLVLSLGYKVPLFVSLLGSVCV